MCDSECYCSNREVCGGRHHEDREGRRDCDEEWLIRSADKSRPYRKRATTSLSLQMLAGNPNAPKLAFDSIRALLKSDMRLAELELNDVVLREGGVVEVESPVSAKDRQTLLRREEATTAATAPTGDGVPAKTQAVRSIWCGLPASAPRSLPARVQSTAFAW